MSYMTVTLKWVFRFARVMSVTLIKKNIYFQNLILLIHNEMKALRLT